MADYNSSYTGSQVDQAVGYNINVTSDVQAQLNSKEPVVTKGNLTESTSAILTITGGTGCVIGSGTTILVKQSNTTTDGYLSATDWNTFNNKQAAITGGASTITSSNLTADRALISNGSGKVAVSDITSTELSYLDNASSNLQSQINAKQNSITGAASTITSSDLTANRATISNASGKIAVSSVSDVELSYLQGVTSSIQNQIDNVSASVESTDLSGTTNQVNLSASGTNVLLGSTPIQLSLPQDVHSGATPNFAGVNLSGLTANRALASDGSKNVVATSVTDTELGFLSGTTSNLQNQIDNISVTTESSNISGTVNQISISPTGNNVILGSTPITLSLEQDIATSSSPTFTGLNLSGTTADRVLVTDGSKNISSSSVTATQLSYVDATSSIQTQLNSKASNFDVTDLVGTANQILLSENGTGVLLGATPIQISLVQDLDTQATPVFAGLQLNNLTDGRVVINDGNQLSSSIITNVELSYLDNLTGNVQSQINNIDASQVNSGVFNIARIPAAALERLVNVADETARYALTTATVHNGDTVRENDTGLMYIVVDEDNLNNSSGYQVYTAGSAASVAWTGVTGTPTTLSGYGITDGQAALDFSDITSGSNISLTGNTTEVIIGATPVNIDIVSAPTFTGLNLTGLTADKVVLTDGSKNLSSSSVGSTQLGYISNLSSDAQSQIDSKANSFETSDITGDSNITVSNGTNVIVGSTPVELTLIQDLGLSATPVFANVNLTNLTSDKALIVDSDGLLSSSSVGSTQLNYISTLSSNAQDQINAKQATITGAATTITTSDLTGERALISNASGKVAVSSITESELNNLSGSTSNLQNQIDNISATVETSNLSGDSNINVSYGTNVVVGSTPVALSLNTGNLTETGSSVFNITNGTDAVLNNVTIEMQAASNLQDGYLTKEDWSNFNASGGSVSTTDLNADGNIVLSPNGSGILVGSTPVNISTVQSIGLSATPVFANLNLTNLGQNIVPIINASGLFESSITGTTELGYISTLSSNAQDQINSKENTLTKGNLTEATSSVLTITGGTNSQIGTGTSIQVKQSGISQDGYLSSTDWNSFNNKLSSIETSDLTGDSNITISPTTSNIIVGSTPIELQLIQDITIASTPVFAGLKLTNLTNGKAVIVDTNGELSTSSTGITQLDYISTLSSNAQDQINSKENTLTKGNLTESTSSVLTITGGTGSQIGSGTSIQVQESSISQDGYLSSTNFNLFNNKANAFDTSNITGDSNLTITNGEGIIVSATPCEISLIQDIGLSATPVFAGLKITNLNNDKVVIVDTNGELSSSNVSTTELSYLDNVTSDVQSQLSNIDASRINSGTINIDRLPKGALERLVTVADETARFALTTNEVQNGDSVRQVDVNIMYFVIDDTNLNNASGYQEYTAGTATSVPFSGITSLPTTLSGYGIQDGQTALDFTDINTGNNISITGGTTSDIIIGTTPIVIDTIQGIRTVDSPTFTGLNLSGLTASRVTITDGSKNISSSIITSSELETLDNITGNVQTQLDSKANNFDTSNITGDSNISITNGTDVIVSSTPVEISLIQDIGLSATPTFSNIELSNLTNDRVIISENGLLSSSVITKTELEALDNISGNIQSALNAKEDTLTKGNLTETTSNVINITGGTNAVIGSGVTLEITESSGSTNGYLSSTNFNVFNNKANSFDTSNVTSGSNISLSGDTEGIIVSATPLNIDIVASPTFTGLNLSGLTADRVAITDGSKNISSSAITTSELESLDNISGNVQSQLDLKANNFDTSDITSGSNITLSGDTTGIIVSATPLVLDTIQDITISSTPVFANLEITNLTNDRVIYKNNDLLQSSNVDSTTLSYLENVSSDIQSQINAKENTLTKGNLTETVSNVINIVGGTNSVIGSGVTLEITQASSSTDGYLSSTDWNSFNNKADAGGVVSSDLSGTTDQINVSFGEGVMVGSTPVTLSLPQSIATNSDVTFNSLNLGGLTASRVTITDGSKNLSSSTITSTELEALDNISGNIQDSLNSKEPTFDKSDITSGNSISLTGDTTGIIISATPLNIDTIQDIRTSASPQFTGLNVSGLTASKVVLTDGSKNLSTSSVSDTELSYLSGVTSSVQNQLNSKASNYDVSNIEGTDNQIIVANGENVIVSATPVTLSLSQNIDISATPVFAGLNITGLTTNRALQSNANQDIESSNVTSTELSYLSGVTSGIQSQLSNIDASRINSGTIDIARLPKGALERLVTVADETARFALTTNEVQNGDSVRQVDTNIMYFVIDDSNLNNSSGYQEYTAGTATSVPFSGVTGKPTTLSGYGITDAQTALDFTDINNGSSITITGDTTGIIIGTTPISINTVQGISTSDSPTFTGTTLSGLTANRALIANGSKGIESSSVTSTELGYISGLQSSAQDQLNSKANSFTTADLSGTANQVSVTANSGVLVGSTPITISLEQDIATSSNVTFNGLNLGGLTASRAVVTNGSKDLSSSATTADQIGYLSNVTSDVQSQINSKESLLDKSDITNGNSITLSGDTTDIIISATPLTIDTIQDIRTSASPTFVTTTLSGLTASRALVSDGSKNVSSSNVLSSELEFLSGVTSSVQDQIDSKSDNFDISNIEGTINQITVSNGTNVIISATPVTLSLPQSISTTSDVQFGGITILDNQDANTKLQITNTNSHIDAQSALTLTSSNKTVELAMNSASDIYWSNKANLELDTESGFVINRGTTKLFEMDSDTGNSIFVGNLGIAATPIYGAFDVVGNAYIEGNIGINIAPTNQRFTLNGDMQIQTGAIAGGTSSDLNGLYKFISYGTDQQTGNSVVSILEEDTEADTYLIRMKSGNSTFSSATDRFYISTLGSGYLAQNLGIGTAASGSYLLDSQRAGDALVKFRASSDGQSVLYLDGYKTSNATTSQLVFMNQGDSVAAIVSQRENADDAGNIILQTQPTGGGLTDRMTINSTGNVGIGDIKTVTDYTNLLSLTTTTNPSLTLYDGGESANQRLAYIGSNQQSIVFGKANDDGSNVTEYGSFNISGQFGIGVYAGKKLDVNGDVRVRGDSGKVYFYRTTSPTDIAYIGYSHSSGELQLAADTKNITFLNGSGSSQTAQLTSDGKLTIGTTDTTRSLNVNNSIRLKGANKFIEGISATGTEEWVIGNASYNILDGTTLGVGTFTATPVTFITNNVERMRIDASGNIMVGSAIGASSTRTKLHVVGDFDGSSSLPGNNPNKGLLIDKRVNDDYSVNDTFGITFSNGKLTDGNSYSTAGIYAVVTSVSSYNVGDLIFAVNNNTSTLQEALRIKSSGNLGIGTTTPNAKLEISSSSNEKLRINTASIADNYDNFISFQAASNPQFYIGTLGATPITDADFVITDSSYNSLFTLKQTGNGTFWGNLGIGTTSFGTSATKTLAITNGTNPSSTITDGGQMFSKDSNGEAGKACLHMIAESGSEPLVIAGVQIKTDTGDPSNVHEGKMVINTFDNSVKIYADGGWRSITTW